MAPEQPQQKNSNNTAIIIIGAAAVIVALLGVIAVLLFFVFRGSGDTDEAGGTAEPPTLAVTVTTPQPTTVPTIVATLPVPTAGPSVPTGTSTAADGLFLRTGPGTNYPAVAVVPLGTTGQIIGRSADGQWWVFLVPGAPNNQGWASAQFINATNAENVPIIPPPPTPTPPATATPTATPAPDITFTASRTLINAGEMTTLSWDVRNVTAVFMYPIGANFESNGVPGQGSRDVQPFVATTYELRVVRTDNAIELRQIRIEVNGGLENTRWVVQSYNNGTGGVVAIIPGTEMTAVFANGAVNGTAGCNTYSATYQAYENVLSITPATATNLACAQPPGVMEQEQQFLNALRSAARFQISGGQMTIFGAGGETIMNLFRS